MHVRLHAPLATSVLPAPPSSTEEHAFAVVVAATFRFTGAAFVLEPRPMPIDQDLTGSMSPELWRVSDEVPGKASPEVLLVGHAFSPVPTERIPVRLKLGSVDKRCVAVVGAPSQRVPLSSVYLRAASGGEPVRVGPVRSRPPPPGASLDLASFNTAPDDQQLAGIPPGASLVVEGTTIGQGRLEASLPMIRPTAFLAARGASLAEWAPVELACDTLWIDTDGASVVMVWRGWCPQTSGHVELVVGAASRPLKASELAARSSPGPTPAVSLGDDPFEATMELRPVKREQGASPFSRGEASPPRVMPPPQVELFDEDTVGIDRATVVSRGAPHDAEDFDGIFDEDTVGIGHTTMESDAVSFAELAKLEVPVRVEEAKVVSEREGARTVAIEDLDEPPEKPPPRVGEETLEVAAIDPSLLESEPDGDTP